MKTKLTFLILLTLTIVSITIGLYTEEVKNLGGQNADALVKGKVESGYEFVGYIVSDQQKVCAGTLVGEDTIVTAAHCLAETAGSEFYFGLGEFTIDKLSLVPIAVAIFPTTYSIETATGPDIAVAKLTKPIYLSNYAEMGDPYEECDARLVAYGAGVASSALEEMFVKKSGTGCVRAISENFIYMLASNVGMCFGDSGGPIFESREGKMIGVLSGGIVANEFTKLECEPGNNAYVVNASRYTNFILDAVEKNVTEINSSNVRYIENDRAENLIFNSNDLVAKSDLSASTISTSAAVRTELSQRFFVISGILVVIFISGIILIFRYL